MQSLIRSKSAGVTGGRGTAGAGPGRDLLYTHDLHRYLAYLKSVLEMPRPTLPPAGKSSGSPLIVDLTGPESYNPEPRSNEPAGSLQDLHTQQGQGDPRRTPDTSPPVLNGLLT